jgi:hypothetical protein
MKRSTSAFRRVGSSTSVGFEDNVSLLSALTYFCGSDYNEFISAWALIVKNNLLPALLNDNKDKDVAKALNEKLLNRLFQVCC